MCGSLCGHVDSVWGDYFEVTRMHVLYCLLWHSVRYAGAEEFFLPRLLKDLISDAQNGLKRSCSSVYFIVLSQIHDPYLITVADPITY